MLYFNIPQVFEKCICGLLSKRVRIIASRQLQYVERADQILTMRAGTIINEVTAQVTCFVTFMLTQSACNSITMHYIV